MYSPLARSAWSGVMAAAVVAIGVASGTGRGQPASPPPPPSTPGDNPGADSPAAMKERLERRLAQSRASQARIEEALRLVAAGASAADVRRALEPAGGGSEAGSGGRFNRPESERRPEGERRRGEEGGPGRPSMDLGPDGMDGLERDLISGSARPLSSEEREKVRELLRQHRPELAKQLDDMAGGNPEIGNRAIDSVGPRLRGIAELKDRDPKLFQLRLDDIRNVFALLRAAKQAGDGARSGDPAAQATQLDQIKALLGRQFDTRQAIQQHMVDQLSARVEKMRADLAGAGKSREAFIDEKARTLMDRSKHIGEGRRKGEGQPEKPKAPKGG